MSRIAAEDLAELGYTNLKNLDGGFIAWRDAGYPFETAP
jgi:rhodanese-related sulfurtransferase